MSKLIGCDRRRGQIGLDDGLAHIGFRVWQRFGKTTALVRTRAVLLCTNSGASSSRRLGHLQKRRLFVSSSKLLFWRSPNEDVELLSFAQATIEPSVSQSSAWAVSFLSRMEQMLFRGVLTAPEVSDRVLYLFLFAKAPSHSGSKAVQ